MGITNLRLGIASKVNLHVARIRRDHRLILFIYSGENSVIVEGDLLNISYLYSFGHFITTVYGKKILKFAIMICSPLWRSRGSRVYHFLNESIVADL